MILARLPKEIKRIYLENTLIVVVKPLYRVAKAGNHWWATYSKHYREKLSMTILTYDLCLLITTTKEAFRLVRIQTDDTLLLADNKFATKEEIKLKKAKFTSKPREKLT
jgi:N-glycosylase/DNA lyase